MNTYQEVKKIRNFSETNIRMSHIFYDMNQILLKTYNVGFISFRNGRLPPTDLSVYPSYTYTIVPYCSFRYYIATGLIFTWSIIE